MDMKNLSKTQKLTLSGAVMAIYIVIMYVTQSFAFGQYQVRIATAIYGVAYLFPFLVVPLGLSNLLSNMIMGGLGVSLGLSGLIGVPYWTLAVSLLVGQAVAGLVGALLVNALKRIWKET